MLSDHSDYIIALDVIICHILHSIATKTAALAVGLKAGIWPDLERDLMVKVIKLAFVASPRDEQHNVFFFHEALRQLRANREGEAHTTRLP